jgi:ApaG protein
MTFFYRLTRDIRVTAQPRFAAAHSAPALGRYVFVYRIRIENVGDRAARLLWRHWYIHDPAGGDSEVEGEGVIGETPLLAPGEVHEYESYCVLAGPAGHMQGFYEFQHPDDDERFRVEIPRFELRASSG